MIEVDLLPERQRARGARRRKSARSVAGGLKRLSRGKDPWTAAVLATVSIVPLLVLFLWLNQRSDRADLEERLASATADSARLADLRAVSDSLTQRQALVRERTALIEQLDRGRFVWPHLMDEISRAVPKLAWLTTLQQLTPQPDLTVQIQGLAANPLVITEFVRNLQASPYIAEVRILGSQLQELEDELAVHAFTLVASYDAPPGSPRTAPIVSPSG